LSRFPDIIHSVNTMVLVSKGSVPEMNMTSASDQSSKEALKGIVSNQHNWDTLRPERSEI
jgi:hypothetical protein